MRKYIGPGIVIMLVLVVATEMVVFWQNDKKGRILEIKKIENVLPEPTVETTITPTIVITKAPTKIKAKPTNSQPWGTSKQIGEYTWTIRVGEDEKMATATEILVSLNEYRRVHGSQTLNWDERLAKFAQERAVFLNSKKNVDGHKGFSDYLENSDGFKKLGFTLVGENISYGYKLSGVHIIEWMYAGDKPHNDNQLDNRWNYVGIGVDGLATCVIFGTGKN